MTLESMKLKELRQEAKRVGLKGHYNLRKSDLLAALVSLKSASDTDPESSEGVRESGRTRTELFLNNPDPSTLEEEDFVKVKSVWFRGRKKPIKDGKLTHKSIVSKPQNNDPMPDTDRILSYVRQNGTSRLTTKQKRRARQKDHRSG